MYFPFNRKTYPGIKGPLFDDEIQNAMNGLYTLTNALLGLGPTDFAILSGFTYTAGSPGHYSGGLVYMSGKIYYSIGGVNVGQYLVPITTSIENKPHGDGVSRDTYEEYLASASNTPATGGSPIFSSNMDAYRWNILKAKTQAIASAATDATTKANAALASAEAYTDAFSETLGDAAFKNTGNTAGTVAPGDDARFAIGRGVPLSGTPPANWNVILRAFKYGSLITFTIGVKCNSGATNDLTSVYTFGTNDRPSDRVYFGLVPDQENVGNYTGYGYVEPDGTIKVSVGNLGFDYVASVSFFASTFN